MNTAKALVQTSIHTTEEQNARSSESAKRIVLSMHEIRKLLMRGCRRCGINGTPSALLMAIHSYVYDFVGILLDRG
jgi:hypothetical protein